MTSMEKISVNLHGSISVGCSKMDGSTEVPSEEYTNPEDATSSDKELDASDKTADQEMKKTPVREERKGKKQKRRSIELEKRQKVGTIKEEELSEEKDEDLIIDEEGAPVLETGSPEAKTPERRSNFPRKNPQYCGTGRMPCPYLGEGWYFEQIVRQQGKSAGNYDTYYFSPDGQKFRSKLKLQQHVGKDLKNFDFNAGEVKDKPQEALSTQSPGKTKPAKMYSLKTNQIKTIQTSVISDERKQLKQESQTLKSPQKRKRGRPPLICRFPPVKRALKKRKVATAVEPEEASDIANEAGTETESAVEFKVEKIAEEKITAYERFVKVATPAAELLLEDISEVGELLKCCWECLDDEGQTRFETSFTALNKSNPSADETSTEGKDTDDPTEQESNPENHPNSVDISLPVPQIEGCKKLMPSIPRKKRCGVCSGCTATNCGLCVHCRDMKKFGGSGSKKQSCVQRRCIAIHSPNGKGVLTDMFMRNAYDPGSPPFLNNPSNYEGSLYWGQETQGRELSRLGRMNQSYDEDISATCFPYPDSIEMPDMVSALGANDEFTERDYPLTRMAYRSMSAELSPTQGGGALEDDTHDSMQQHGLACNTTEQRPHKRKSRQPVCIKQNSADNEGAESNLME